MTLMHKILYKPGNAPVDERTPASAFQMNAGAHWKTPSIEGLDTTSFPDYANDASILIFSDDSGDYVYSTATPDIVDGDLIRVPATGPGHFRRVSDAGDLAPIYMAPDIQETLPAVTASLNFGNLTTGAESTLTITVPGARVGDLVQIQEPAALEDGIIVRRKWVSAKNTVSVRVRNLTGGDVNPAEGNFTALVTAPYRIPALTKGAIDLFEALLGGEHDGTSLETALGDDLTYVHFWLLISSRWRMQALLDNADARDAIEDSAIADAAMELIDGAGY